jgi:hypothetical protein
MKREIYEGDVIQKYGEPSKRRLVGFDEHAFEGGIPDYFGFPYFDEPTDWKVIGNIYENPELLK